MLDNPNQVTVTLPEELRAYLRRAAAEQERSVSYVLRELVADAARKAQQPQRAA
jgi:predicted transcriptional regulator